jgi:hypothetical protein
MNRAVGVAVYLWKTIVRASRVVTENGSALAMTFVRTV